MLGNTAIYRLRLKRHVSYKIKEWEYVKSLCSNDGAGEQHDVRGQRKVFGTEFVKILYDMHEKGMIVFVILEDLYADEWAEYLDGIMNLEKMITEAERK